MFKKYCLILGLALCFNSLAARAQEGAAVQPAVVDVGNAICPISGDEAAPDVSYVHEGKRYHFCCAGCIKKFKKDPAQYLAQLEKGEPAAHEHAGHEHAGH